MEGKRNVAVTNNSENPRRIKKKKEKIIVGMRNDEMPFIETLATWNKQKKNDESLNVFFFPIGAAGQGKRRSDFLATRFTAGH